jgi:ABC-type transport system substrate-binding protein
MGTRFFRASVAVIPLVALMVCLEAKPLAWAQDDKKPKTKPPVEETGGTKPKTKPPIEEEDSAKPQKKKPPIEEGDGSKPPKKKPPTEEETPVKPPKKPPMEVETPKKPAVEKVDLLAEAGKTASPMLKDLYRSLAIPMDRINLKREGWRDVEPIPVYIGEKANQGKVQYKPFESPGVVSKATFTADGGDIIAGVSYEQIAIRGVGGFLANSRDLLPGNANYLSEVDRLTAADKILTVAYTFHEEARKTEKRKGAGWDGVRDELQTKYLDVLSDELKALNASSDKAARDRAVDVVIRINEMFPDNLKAQKEVAVWKLTQVGNDLNANDTQYFDAYKTLRRLLVKHPNADPKIMDPFKDILRRRAQAHFDEARKLAATDDGKPSAFRQLDMAMKIWPDLSGLKDYHEQLGREYRLLVVGVNRLPELMSPGMTLTDPDRWAMELVFESLVRPVPDQQVGQRYEPGLALRLPKIVYMGREFEMPQDAVWVHPDGTTEKFNSGAVRGTLALLQDPKFRGMRVAETVDLIAPSRFLDPFRFTLKLDRGTIEPLAAMTFKILPADLLEKKPDRLLDRDFAMNPVGSGPYVYHGRRVEDGREYSVFKANPYYGKRTDRFGLPRIHEIRFVVPSGDPAAELRDGKLDMMLDLPTLEVMRMRDPKYELAKSISEVSLPSRRIWMLAVNHRQKYFQDDAGRALRRAIAFAIDRDETLKVFRAGTQHHKELNGPFPNDTWAVPPAPPKLFRFEQAKFEAEKAAGKPDRLTLKFVDNPLAREACNQIKQQVARAGINLDLVPLSPADLHKAVYLEWNYDLAYMPFDYADNTFSLRGLFEEEGRNTDRGERNFLGYRPDPKISQSLSIIRGTRNRDEITKAKHRLYNAFEDQMPFIPLWQLDFHILINNNVQTVPSANQLDPLTIFDQVDEWRLNR